MLNLFLTIKTKPMKKLSGIILMTAFMLFLTSQVIAQSTTGPVATIGGTNKECPKFVDNNKDGICDNYTAKADGGKGVNYVDANMDGICDHRADSTFCKGNGNGCKQNCQNMQNCNKGQGNCCGQAKGMGARHGNCCARQCPAQNPPEKK
jgi:hypothetical protein